MDNSETEKIARKVTKTLRDKIFDVEDEEIVASTGYLHWRSRQHCERATSLSADLTMYDAKSILVCGSSLTP